jgi:hypothetical protein
VQIADDLPQEPDLYKNGLAVGDCPGATQLPDELDACRAFELGQP